MLKYKHHFDICYMEQQLNGIHLFNTAKCELKPQLFE